MHSLNAKVIAAEFVAERLDSAAHARRAGRFRRRRFLRGERRDAPSSPVSPARLSTSGAGR